MEFEEYKRKTHELVDTLDNLQIVYVFSLILGMKGEKKD